MSVIYEQIYKIVQSIPRGRVLTYGLISHMIGGRMSAQGVGWALKALGSRKRNETLATASRAEPVYNSNTVPWQRVVNAQGGTSTYKIPEIPPDLQRQLLEQEGIVFDAEGKINLTEYLWMEGASGVSATSPAVKRKPLANAKSKSKSKPKSEPVSTLKPRSKSLPQAITKNKARRSP